MERQSTSVTSHINLYFNFTCMGFKFEGVIFNSELKFRIFKWNWAETAGVLWFRHLKAVQVTSFVIVLCKPNTSTVGKSLHDMTTLSDMQRVPSSRIWVQDVAMRWTWTWRFRAHAKVPWTETSSMSMLPGGSPHRYRCRLRYPISQKTILGRLSKNPLSLLFQSCLQREI